MVNQRPYIGKVVEVDDGDVYISFMTPHLGEDHQYFHWPGTVDRVWVEMKDVLCVVPEPTPNKRGFTLPSSYRNSALDLYSTWLT